MRLDPKPVMFAGTTKVEITLRGRPGHGSVPRAADNALVRAAEAVARVQTYDAPSLITPGELLLSLLVVVMTVIVMLTLQLLLLLLLLIWVVDNFSWMMPASFFWHSKTLTE